MDQLIDRIKSDGYVENDEILKVDSFINHQVDVNLMLAAGKDIANHFKDQGITKVVTIESSGISPALMSAMALDVPMIVLKKQPSKILNKDLLQTEITSFTKEINYELTIKNHLINENDHVLIVDDFMANGETATGALRLIRAAHATVAGVAVLIEKTFQNGSSKLKEQGIELYSLAKIKSLKNGKIEFERSVSNPPL